jgi:hypothetical protein
VLPYSLRPCLYSLIYPHNGASPPTLLAHACTVLSTLITVLPYSLRPCLYSLIYPHNGASLLSSPMPCYPPLFVVPMLIIPSLLIMPVLPLSSPYSSLLVHNHAAFLCSSSSSHLCFHDHSPLLCHACATTLFPSAMPMLLFSFPHQYLCCFSPPLSRTYAATLLPFPKPLLLLSSLACTCAASPLSSLMPFCFTGILLASTCIIIFFSSIRMMSHSSPRPCLCSYSPLLAHACDATLLSLTMAVLLLFAPLPRLCYYSPPLINACVVTLTSSPMPVPLLSSPRPCL